MKLKTVPPDSLKPKAAEYLPLQLVPLRQVYGSWWLLWVLPVAVLIGYVSGTPLQRIFVHCGMGADAAAWGAMALLASGFSVLAAYCVSWLLACRRNVREAREKKLLPVVGGSGMPWFALAMASCLALAGPATGRLYVTARTYGHRAVMRAAAPLVLGGERRYRLFTRELQSGDAEAQRLWRGSLDLDGQTGCMTLLRALRCRQFECTRWLADAGLPGKDSLWVHVALDEALCMNAPADLVLQFAEACGDQLKSHENAILCHADDDTLRTLAQRSPALRKLLQQDRCADFLRDVRHLDPATLQPLPDTHEN